MEILPISSTHLIWQPLQASLHPDKCHRTSHSYNACLQQAINPFCSSLESSINVVPWRKDKVVFVLGSSGTGKSKLAIDLAIHFGGEVVNSDKMQVYGGLNIITNKVTEEECAGIPHHLIGGIHPDSDFTASDFCGEATCAVESIVARGRIPIIAGGSNSYIEELVDGNGGKFRSKYECCFVWIDVDLSVLHSFVSHRVDKMVEMGLVEEARGMFDPAADYSKGIRRSIGIPEMDRYFRADEESKVELLEEAINEIKENTCKLTYRQLQKIRRLSTLAGWDVQRVDATQVFRERGEAAEQVWKQVAREAGIKIVEKFLEGNMVDERVFKNLMSNIAVAANASDDNGIITVEASTMASAASSEHEYKVATKIMGPAVSCISR